MKSQAESRGKTGGDDFSRQDGGVFHEISHGGIDRQGGVEKRRKRRSVLEAGLCKRAGKLDLSTGPSKLRMHSRAGMTFQIALGAAPV